MKSTHLDTGVLGSGLRAQGGCPQPPAPSPQRGFSLIELLMATVIVAAAGAMLVGGLVASNRSAELRIERALLTQLLASRLALLDDEISQQTPTSGAFSPPLEDFTWTLEQMPLAGGPLVEAAVTVNRRDDAAHVVTYRRLAAE